MDVLRDEEIGNAAGDRASDGNRGNAAGEKCGSNSASTVDAESVGVSNGRALACITNATSRCTDGIETNRDASSSDNAPVPSNVNRNGVSDSIDSADESTFYEVTSSDMDEGTLLKCQFPDDNNSSDDVYSNASEDRIVAPPGDVIPAAGSENLEESLAVASSNSIIPTMSFIDVQCADDNAVGISNQTLSEVNKNGRCHQGNSNFTDLHSQPTQQASLSRQQSHGHRSSHRIDTNDSDTEKPTSLRRKVQHTVKQRNIRNRTIRPSERANGAHKINSVEQPRLNQAETRRISVLSKIKRRQEQELGRQLTITSMLSLGEPAIKAWCLEDLRCTLTHISPLCDGCTLYTSIITLDKPVSASIHQLRTIQLIGGQKCYVSYVEECWVGLRQLGLMTRFLSLGLTAEHIRTDENFPRGVIVSETTDNDHDANIILSGRLKYVRKSIKVVDCVINRGISEVLQRSSSESSGPSNSVEAKTELTVGNGSIGDQHGTSLFPRHSNVQPTEASETNVTDVQQVMSLARQPCATPQQISKVNNVRSIRGPTARILTAAIVTSLLVAIASVVSWHSSLPNATGQIPLEDNSKLLLYQCSENMTWFVGPVRKEDDAVEASDSPIYLHMQFTEVCNVTERRETYASTMEQADIEHKQLNVNLRTQIEERIELPNRRLDQMAAVKARQFDKLAQRVEQKTMTPITRLTSQVWELFTNLSAQSSDTYDYIKVRLSRNKITGASTDDVIIALNQFASNHPDMKAYVNYAICNVQGMLPGGTFIKVLHNGKRNGAKLKFICLLVHTYINKQTGKLVHDYVLMTYGYDDTRADDLDRRLNVIPLAAFGAGALGLALASPSFFAEWGATHAVYLPAAVMAGVSMFNNEWKLETIQLETSTDLTAFLEAVFVHDLVQHKLAIVDFTSRTLSLHLFKQTPISSSS